MSSSQDPASLGGQYGVASSSLLERSVPLQPRTDSSHVTNTSLYERLQGYRPSSQPLQAPQPSQPLADRRSNDFSSRTPSNLRLSASAQRSSASPPVPNQAPYSKPTQGSAQLPSLAPAPVASRSSASQPTQGGPRFYYTKDQVAAWNSVVQEAAPELLQKVLRDNWRKFLFNGDHDTETHLSYILRAGYKNAPVKVIERCLEDKDTFEKTFLRIATSHKVVIEQVLHSATVPQLLQHVPVSVLDQALADRLQNIPAKEIVRWLATANRLGYQMDDIIDGESVLPNIESTRQYLQGKTDGNMSGFENNESESLNAERIRRYIRENSGNTESVLSNEDKVRQYLIEKRRENAAGPEGLGELAGVSTENDKANVLPADPLLAEQMKNARESGVALSKSSDPMRCPRCGEHFEQLSNYNHHVSKKVCLKRPRDPDPSRFTCEHCAKEFTTKQGWKHHLKTRICQGGIQNDLQPGFRVQNSSQPAQQIAPLGQPSSMSLKRAADVSAEVLRYERDRASNTTLTPLHTPVSGFEHQSSPMSAGSSFRMAPEDLPPEKLAEMNQALQAAEDRYASDRQQAIDTLQGQARDTRLTSLKNSYASRQSNIRKTYGVTLRPRQSDKAARAAALATPQAPTPTGFRAANAAEKMKSHKRQKIDSCYNQPETSHSSAQGRSRSNDYQSPVVPSQQAAASAIPSTARSSLAQVIIPSPKKLRELASNTNATITISDSEDEEPDHDEASGQIQQKIASPPNQNSAQSPDDETGHPDRDNALPSVEQGGGEE